ncbi:hypothetical protein [Dysgonomonas alginatilytica]|nr:hypothetical protein [Dysgonomonas alginatilytica]
MKKNILLTIAFLTGTVLWAQIGINTETPQKLFHVDAVRNTSGVTNVSDDAVVDAAGNMGLGVLSPTAKLHIAGDGTTPALRIVDGTQKDTRILRSDASGNATWVDQPASGGFIYNVLGNINYRNGTTSLVKAMQITEAGNYLVVVRWWGTTTSAGTNNETSAYLYLDQGSDGTASRGTAKDAIEYYVRTIANSPFCFTTSLYATVSAGSWLKLFISPSIGSTGTTFNWVLGTASVTNPNWNPSIVLFKI